jgi:hypothetical protein
MEITEMKSDKDVLLLRINRTLELINMFEKGIRLSESLDAPKSIIAQDEDMKTRLVNELVDLLAEMNVHLSLKTAA